MNSTNCFYASHSIVIITWFSQDKFDILNMSSLDKVIKYGNVPIHFVHEFEPFHTQATCELNQLVLHTSHILSKLYNMRTSSNLSIGKQTFLKEGRLNLIMCRFQIRLNVSHLCVAINKTLQGIWVGG